MGTHLQYRIELHSDDRAPEGLVSIYQECARDALSRACSLEDTIEPILRCWHECGIPYDTEELWLVIDGTLKVLWWVDATGVCDYLTYSPGRTNASVDELAEELIQRLWSCKITLYREQGSSIEEGGS